MKKIITKIINWFYIQEYQFQLGELILRKERGETDLDLAIRFFQRKIYILEK